MNALVAGRRAYAADVRLHQFVRAVEGLLPAEAWGRDAFVDYAVTLVSEAPDPVPLLRDLYQLRNIAEHPPSDWCRAGSRASARPARGTRACYRGGLLATPLAAETQPAAKVARIGWLWDNPTPGHPLREPASSSPPVCYVALPTSSIPGASASQASGWLRGP